MKRRSHLFQVFVWKDDYWFRTGTTPGERLVSLRPDHLNNDLRCFYDVIYVNRIFNMGLRLR
jgi:hypothetical protein